MLLMSTARLYLGMHYPTDVLGGWLAALAWVMVLRRFVLAERGTTRTGAGAKPNRLARRRVVALRSLHSHHPGRIASPQVNPQRALAVASGEDVEHPLLEAEIRNRDAVLGGSTL